MRLVTLCTLGCFGSTEMVSEVNATSLTGMVCPLKTRRHSTRDVDCKQPRCNRDATARQPLTMRDHSATAVPPRHLPWALPLTLRDYEHP